MFGLSGTGIFWALLSFVSSTMSCVGYFMPYWISGELIVQMNQQSEQRFPVHFGLFRRCNYLAVNYKEELSIVLECGRYRTFSDIPSLAWQIATLLIGLACVLCFLVSLTAIFGICVEGVVFRSIARSAGVLQLCSGLLIAAGIGVYPKGWNSPEVQEACGNTSMSYFLGTCSLSWCFYLTSAGACTTILCSFLACNAPKQKQLVSGHAV